MKSKEAWGCFGSVIGALIALIGTLVIAGNLTLPEISLFDAPNIEATVAASTVLYRDSFGNSESGWAAFSETYRSASYENGEYVLRALSSDFIGGGYNKQVFTNVRIQVVARNTGRADDVRFGVGCNIQEYADFDNNYTAGISSDGYYAITKVENGILTSLTDPKNNGWLKSSEIALKAPKYNITFECAFEKLTLYVDGKLIASVNDSNFTQGFVGVFLRPYIQQNSEIRFDSIVITSAE